MGIFLLICSIIDCIGGIIYCFNKPNFFVLILLFGSAIFVFWLGVNLIKDKRREQKQKSIMASQNENKEFKGFDLSNGFNVPETYQARKDFRGTKSVGTRVKLSLDENEKKWCIIHAGRNDHKIYDYSDIMDFELVEDGEKFRTEGTVLRSVVGGVLFGTVGAVVGATTGKTVSSVDSMYINIYTKSGNLEKIQLLYGKADKNSPLYKEVKDTAERMMAALYAIKHNA